MKLSRFIKPSSWTLLIATPQAELERCLSRHLVGLIMQVGLVGFTFSVV